MASQVASGTDSAESVAVEPEASGVRGAIRRATLWLGPAAALGDASIVAGIAWFVALMIGLWLGAAVFGLLLTAVAAMGAWQAVEIRAAPERVAGGAAGGALDKRHRLPAAALAGAVGLAGTVHTRLAGMVLAAAVVASFIVVAALGRRPVGSQTSRPRARSAPAPAAASNPADLLSRVGGFSRTWLHTGVAAACAASVARFSLSAALVLVSAAAFYDAAAHLSASGRPAGLRAPATGALAAAIIVFAFTGLSAPPFGPADATRLGLIAGLTLPLGPALARGVSALAVRRLDWAGSEGGASEAERGSALAKTAQAGEPKTAGERLVGRFLREWGVRRLDSLSVTALAWMWGIGLLTL